MSKFDPTTSYETIQSKPEECSGDDREITKNYDVIRRDERDKEALELTGCSFTNGARDMYGNKRKHIDILYVISGPHKGLIGKHTERRIDDSLYISIVEGPRTGELVLVKEDDLDWYDDWLKDNTT